MIKLTRKQFDQKIEYLTKLEEAIKNINSLCKEDDNDMLYAHLIKKGKKQTTHYQFVRSFGYVVDINQRWIVNVYTYDNKTGEDLKVKQKFYANTVEKLWEKLVNEKVCII